MKIDFSEIISGVIITVASSFVLAVGAAFTKLVKFLWGNWQERQRRKNLKVEDMVL